MKIILQIGSHDGDDTVTHHAVEHFPLLIGRGYQNDIILPDPHVSPRHLEILHNGTDWTLRDLGSHNGVSINGKPCRDGQAVLHSGDTITIGRTDIRVFNPHHPVMATQPLEKLPPVIAHISRPAAAWFYFLLAMAVACGTTYLELWSDNVRAQLANMAGMTGLGLIFWAVPWAVTGRLVRHQSAFRTHIAIGSLALIVACILWPIQSVINFITNENIAATIIDFLCNLLMLSAVIAAALAVSTHMTGRRRWLSGLFFSGGFLGIIAVLGYLGSLDFSPLPVYPTTLEPYFHQLADTVTLDAFMTDNTALFDTDIATTTAEAPQDTATVPVLAP